jgi:hypothetical protein
MRKALAVPRYESCVIMSDVCRSRCLGCPEIHSMAGAKPSVNASCRVGSGGVPGSLIHVLRSGDDRTYGRRRSGGPLRPSRTVWLAGAAEPILSPAWLSKDGRSHFTRLGDYGRMMV